MISEKDESLKTEYATFYISKAMDAIINNYCGRQLTHDELVHAAIKGMTEILDNYSVYIHPPLFSEKLSPDIIADQKVTVLLECNNGIQVIKISRFENATIKELNSIITQLRCEAVRSVIIDLRGNSGGMLSSLVGVCNLLIPKGLLFYSQNKDGRREAHFSTLAAKPFDKIMVLVDGSTMSAAEIFAFALQENGALVVGDYTFGKSVAQTTFKLYNGGALVLTTLEMLDRHENRVTRIAPNKIVDANKAEEVAILYLRSEVNRNLETNKGEE